MEVTKMEVTVNRRDCIGGGRVGGSRYEGGDRWRWQ